MPLRAFPLVLLALLATSAAAAQTKPLAPHVSSSSEQPQATAAVPPVEPAEPVDAADADEAASEATSAEPDAAAADAATAETEMATTAATDGGKIGAPQPGKGQVVFFRPSKFAGGAVGFKVREGETELGKLRSGRYFVAQVEPGTHQYRVHSETEDLLTMEVEAGETYYVQGTITMGFLAGRPNLSPSDEATFNGMADKLKLAR